MELKKEQQEKLAEYEELKLQIKELEKKAKDLAPDILAFLPGDKEIECKQGKIYLQNRTVWTYPPVIQDKEKELKGLKKEAQAKGDAVVEHIPTLYYTVNKK